MVALQWEFLVGLAPIFFKKFLVYLLTPTLLNVIKLYLISTILSRVVLTLCSEELPQGFS